MWVDKNGNFYEGDMQYGDREATSAELKTLYFKQELAALTATYNADVAVYKTAWLSSAVADGATEVANKAAVVTAVTTRKSQYVADMATLRAKYA